MLFTMNKILTLSAALLAVSSISFAGNNSVISANGKTVSVPKVQRQQSTVVDSRESQRLALPQVLDSKAPALVVDQAKKASFKNGRLQATGKYAALYQPVGFLKSGIWFNEETQEFGYNYRNSIILGQTFTSYFEPLTTVDSWACNTIDVARYDFVDSDNNFTITPFGVPASYYCPTLTTGSATYTYGDAGLGTSTGSMTYPERSVFYASDGENMPVGVYDFWCGGRFYSGYTNTPAYGSYNRPDAIWDINEETNDTTYCQLNSNTLLIDLGNIPGFVVEKLHLSGYPYVQDLPLMNGATLTFSLIDYDETGVDETKVYNGTITADDFVNDGDWFTAAVSFVDEDEDGFVTDIAPVVRHSAQLVISGFYQDGVDFAIPMMYSADNSGNTDFMTHSYYDLFVDGKQYLDKNGDPVFTSDDYTDAVVNLLGHFTYIGGTEGEKTFEGWVDDTSVYDTLEDGTKYTTAYAQLGDDGKAYNDFDYLSTFGTDLITIECDEEKVLDFEADSTYYADYGVYMLFVAVTDKLAPGETTSVKVFANNEDYMTINITNRIGQGIKGVNKDAEKEDTEIYNLQGVKVAKSEAELPAGVYVKNGKKFVK